MTTAAAAAHVAATRITGFRTEVKGPLSDVYHGWHRDLTAQLRTRFSDLQECDLHVACTANARSELLALGPAKVIVHDQHLGRTLNRLTQFVLGDWPASRVQAWAFERVAVAGFAAGDLEGARLALAMSSQLRTQNPVPAIDPKLDDTRKLFVSLQEFFVLAHEVAHTALGEHAHGWLEQHFRDEIREGFSRQGAIGREYAEAIAEQMVSDVVAAIGRHFGSVNPSPEQLEDLRQFALRGEKFDEFEWLQKNPYLYEEIACDLIATELTIDRFAKLADVIDPQAVLPALLMGLHHLTSIEYLHGIGDPRVEDTEHTLQAAMVRKSAWRQVTRAMYHDQVPVAMGDMYTQVTQHQAGVVGDQALFIVPVMWQQARELLTKRSEPDGGRRVDADRLRELIWSLADPG